MTTIDLNADLGEGVRTHELDTAALDDALLEVVTSANVACGGHAGDDESMARVCRVAMAHGVAVGAQVSYVDRAGFGRTRLDVDTRTLRDQLVEQVRVLRHHARDAGTDVGYLKPHGALYNAAADDPEVASAVIDAVLRDAETHGRPLPVLTLPGCVLATAATARGLVVVGEAFADRAYASTGRLVPRGTPGALVTDADDVVSRVMRLVRHGVIRSVDGVDVPIAAGSVCLHSDSDGALTLARALRSALAGADVRVEPFVGAAR